MLFQIVKPRAMSDLEKDMALMKQLQLSMSRSKTMYVSGFTFRTGSKCDGHFAEKPMVVMAPEACAAFCMSHPQCQAFTQYHNAMRCGQTVEVDTRKCDRCRENTFSGCFLYESVTSCVDGASTWATGQKGTSFIHLTCIALHCIQSAIVCSVQCRE